MNKWMVLAYILPILASFISFIILLYNDATEYSLRKGRGYAAFTLAIGFFVSIMILIVGSMPN